MLVKRKDDYKYVKICHSTDVISLDFSNESFAKSNFSFALIIEEKHTVWYNNIDKKYKNEIKKYILKRHENHKFCITKR